MHSETYTSRCPSVATIATDGLRMSVERVTCAATGGHLHLRLLPASAPDGALSGPRLAMELRPEHARALAALLIAQADGIAPGASASDEHAVPRLMPEFIAAIDDLHCALSQAGAMASHAYGASADGFHAMSEQERDNYMWCLADRIREARAAARRMIPAPAEAAAR